MTRNLDVFCPETCTRASNHERNYHRPLTICFWSGLSSTIFVNSGGMRDEALMPNQHWHKGIQSRLVEQSNRLTTYLAHTGRSDCETRIAEAHQNRVR